MSVEGPTDLLAGRYRLDQQVTSGGFSEVWRATDTVLQRPVAVKLLRARVSADPQGPARFRDQAQHAGALADQNIARVYDYYEPGPGYPAFLVMEFVDGTSLAEELAAGPLPPARVMDLVAQCAAGLATAHEAGLVHRDITPANILISNDGLVKLTGFGISDAAAAAPVTGTGTPLGTSAYLAPERARGDQGTAAADLFSLGVVAYQCLAGRVPFGEPAPGAVAHSLLSPLPPSVPAEAAALVGRLTAEDPQARPASAGQVAREAGELADRLTPGNTRDSRAVPPALGPAAEPATAGPPHPWDLAHAGDATHPWEMPRPAVPRRRRRRPLFAAAAILSVLAAALVVSLASQATQIDAAAAPPMSDLVQVDGQALHGRPVGAVHRLLHHLGLAVRVRWRSSDRLPPGRVLSVRPNGLVHSGSIVVVTAAQAPTAGARDAGGTAGQPAPGRGQAHARRAAHRAPRPRPTADPSPTGSPAPTGSPSPTGGPPSTSSPSPTPSSGPTAGAQAP